MVTVQKHAMQGGLKKKKLFSGKNMTEIKTGSLLPQTLIKHHLLQIPHDLRATHLDNAML